jgi:hypothetical protein
MKRKIIVAAVALQVTLMTSGAAFGQMSFTDAVMNTMWANFAGSHNRCPSRRSVCGPSGCATIWRTRKSGSRRSKPGWRRRALSSPKPRSWRWRRPRPKVHGEFESGCPGYCGAQDTFYVGNMKGVGRIYQQTFIDTYAKVAFAKLYDRKRQSPRPRF